MLSVITTADSRLQMHYIGFILFLCNLTCCVLIVKRIPCVGTTIIYARSTNETEFWVSILEKAYAKVHARNFGL